MSLSAHLIATFFPSNLFYFPPARLPSSTKIRGLKRFLSSIREKAVATHRLVQILDASHNNPE